jgi:hypothetical protein
MDSLLLQTHSDFFKTAIAEQHSIASEHRKVKPEVSRTAIGTNKDEARAGCDLLRKDADENRRIRPTGDAARFTEPDNCP